MCEQNVNSQEDQPDIKENQIYTDPNKRDTKKELKKISTNHSDVPSK